MSALRLNGAEILKSDRALDAQKLQRIVLQRARGARLNPANFIEFVMREETTRKPIKVAPHQRLALEFIMAHERSVNMWPINSSKTFLMAGLTLFFLGQDPTLRGAVVSATRTQAEKIISVVRDYIETSVELAMVFPHLRKSSRPGDSWTQSSLTVERPPGIKDASVVAHGIDSGTIVGARLKWVIGDDILNFQNTSNKEQRDATYEWFGNSVLSRVDIKDGRVAVTNTAWHPDDLLHRLSEDPPKGPGWPRMRMDVYGDIEIKDDFERVSVFKDLPWDSNLLRPASPSPNETICRLVAHDPDPNNSVPLWPERCGIEWIERKKLDHLPKDFNQLLRNICRDENTAMCKMEYIERCLKVARDLGIYSLTSSSRSPHAKFTGVDLAIDVGDSHADTAFFTFEIWPNGLRVILDIEVGQWPGPVILDKIFAKQKAYDSVVRVENNQAQDYLRQFALQRNMSIPIKPHTTGRAKAHPEYGVASVFLELANGAWAIPNSKTGEMNQHVKKFVDACLYYSPNKHTDDVLMACLPAGQLITTARGLVPIEKVRIGDRVLTHKGNIREITETFKREYVGELIEVHPFRGQTILMTDNHPVWSASRKEIERSLSDLTVKPNWDFVRSDALAVGDYVLFGYSMQVARTIERLARTPFVGTVYNLHVAEDESYCVEGVAVHNCYFAREQAREWGLLVPSSDVARGGSMRADVGANILAR